jgi:hypothetical protein
MANQTLKPGDVVTYVDQKGRARPALVTAVWGASEFDSEGGGAPSINLVTVDQADGAWDSYGQQIERSSSVVHESCQPAHGNFWRL